MFMSRREYERPINLSYLRVKVASRRSHVTTPFGASFSRRFHAWQGIEHVVGGKALD